MKNEKLMIWLCSIAGIVAVMGFLQWTKGHDERLMRAANAYEQCVKEKYNTTPMEWYWTHGKTMPKCDSKPYYDSTRN